MKKTVLITGATAGIGEACARLFASENYRIIITGRRNDRLEKLKKILSAKTEIFSLHFDIQHFDQVKKALSSLPQEWQQTDILINNAGLAAGLDAFDQANIGDWEQMIDTNIKGLLYISRLVAPGMTARKSGHIINIGSIAGREVYPNGNVYCATKSAVDALTKGMRLDLARHGIRVSSVCPGMVETEFSLVRFKGDKKRAKSVYDNFDPLTPDDVARTILFIANQPSNVNIADVLILPTMQAGASFIYRNDK